MTLYFILTQMRAHIADREWQNSVGVLFLGKYLKLMAHIVHFVRKALNFHKQTNKQTNKTNFFGNQKECVSFF